MKITAILQNLSDSYLNQLSEMSATDLMAELTKQVNAQALKITLKIGNGSFRDRVELNQLQRRTDCYKTAKIETRRGYRLATIETV
jgi:hypothetical protein